ncbi:HlyD family secretion protein [Candidatus Clostridium radicumherbarum]|uniref:HlyD family secretion protein n=1 Tax=Candidatus Clostridium radicumherbarum TaxID=3381662 RepID=A0ABW8TSX5_9CLOT
MKKLIALLMTCTFLATITGCTAKQADDTNKYTATVEAESVYIPSETNGKLSDLSIKQGDIIKSGDKIAVVDTSALALQKKQAEADLTMAKLKLDDLPSKASDNIKQQAQAAVDQAQASVDLIQLQISKATITSSIDGTVSDVFIHKGEMAAQGMNIAKVINLKDKYIKVYVEEAKRNAVKLGDSLPIYYNDKKLADGKVVFIAPQSEFTPKNTESKSDKDKTVFEVKISLSDAADLYPGMMVDVVIK